MALLRVQGDPGKGRRAEPMLATERSICGLRDPSPGSGHRCFSKTSVQLPEASQGVQGVLD